MEILPGDLGKTFQTSVLQRRAISRVRKAMGHVGPADIVVPEGDRAVGEKPRGRHLRRFWLKGADLSTEQSEKVAAVLTKQNVGVSFSQKLMQSAGAWLLLSFLAAFVILRNSDGTAFFMFWGGLWILHSLLAATLPPQFALRRVNKDVLSRGEVETLLLRARDGLEREYLTLVADALRQPVRNQAAANDIKIALRALGETIAQLPAGTAPTIDPAHLRASASEKRSRTAQETDSFVRDSLLRQAEAAERQALAGEQAMSGTRRVQALTAEVRSQMDALRAVLLTFDQQTASTESKVIAAHLAEAVTRAAQEAQSMSLAHRELEDDEIALLYGKPIPATIPQPAVQRLGLGSVPQETPPPTVNRQWWRT